MTAGIKHLDQKGRLYGPPILIILVLPLVVIGGDFLKDGWAGGLLPALKHLGVIAALYLFLFIGAGGFNLFRGGSKASKGPDAPVTGEEKKKP